MDTENSVKPLLGHYRIEKVGERLYYTAREIVEVRIHGASVSLFMASGTSSAVVYLTAEEARKIAHGLIVSAEKALHPDAR